MKRYFHLVMLWLGFGLSVLLAVTAVLGGKIQGTGEHEAAQHLGLVWVGGGSWLAFGFVLAAVSYRFQHTGIHRRLIGWISKALNVFLSVFVLACAVLVILRFTPGFDAFRPIQWLEWLLGPGLAATSDLDHHLGIPASAGTVPMAPVVLAALLILARNSLNWAMTELTGRGREAALPDPKQRRKKEWDTQIRKKAKAVSRRVAVASYAEAKSLLETTEMYLTFLALDVVGSTKMKEGEDPYVIEQSFADYRKLVERMLRRHGAYKQTWTPDGQMAAFHSPQSAVDCGKDILSALPEFNREISRMATDFRVRVGANAGVVSCDDEIPMEEMSDFTIDVAGHMQKYAEPDSLWIAEEVYENLDDPAGFAANGEEVDQRNVYVWKRPS